MLSGRILRSQRMARAFCSNYLTTGCMAISCSFSSWSLQSRLGFGGSKKAFGAVCGESDRRRAIWPAQDQQATIGSSVRAASTAGVYTPAYVPGFVWTSELLTQKFWVCGLQSSEVQSLNFRRARIAPKLRTGDHSSQQVVLNFDITNTDRW